ERQGARRRARRAGAARGRGRGHARLVRPVRRPPRRLARHPDPPPPRQCGPGGARARPRAPLARGPRRRRPDRERGCTHGDVRRQPARPAGARTAPPRSRARRALIHPGAVEHVSETMARDEVMQALEAAVAADVARERGPRAWLRGRSRGARLALLAAAAAAGILLVVAWSPRAGLDDSPAARLALTLGWASAIVLAASFHALRPLHRPPARRRIVAGILFVAVAAPIALAFLPDAHGAAAAP